MEGRANSEMCGKFKNRMILQESGGRSWGLITLPLDMEVLMTEEQGKEHYFQDGACLWR